MKDFNRKIAMGLTLISIIFIPLLGGLMYSLLKVVSYQNQLISKDLEQLFLARELRGQCDRQMSSLSVYVISGNESALNQMALDDNNFNYFLGQLKKIVWGQPDLNLLKKINRDHLNQDTFEAIAVKMKRTGESSESVKAFYRQKLIPGTEKVFNNLDALVEHLSLVYKLEKDNNARLLHRLIKYFGIASTFSVLLFFTITILLLRLIKQKAAYDQTNLLLAQKEIQLSSDRKQVIEIVAHDLKSPLSAIILSAKFLEDIWNKPAERRDNKFLDVIVRSSESMQHLINDLLDHTKIEAGKLILSKSICNVESLLSDISLGFEPIAYSKEIKIIRKFETTNLQMMIDQGRFEQVISNLLNNAIKFTPFGGTIELCSIKSGNEIIISVSDNGPGMTEEQAVHVFERYWQLGSSSGQGTGLGLAISKAITEAHHGKLYVNTHVGIGSTFFVSIPEDEASNICNSQSTN